MAASTNREPLGWVKGSLRVNANTGLTDLEKDDHYCTTDLTNNSRFIEGNGVFTNGGTGLTENERRHIVKENAPLRLR
jgi:hypothetical protein